MRAVAVPPTGSTRTGMYTAFGVWSRTSGGRHASPPEPLPRPIFATDLRHHFPVAALGS